MAFRLAGSKSWLLSVEGPLTTLHIPVPTPGAFPFKVAELFEQIVCGLPALAVVGVGRTRIVTVSVEGLHGGLGIDHCRTYVPARSGSKIAFRKFTLLNCEFAVEGPLATDHTPVCGAGLFPFSCAVPVIQIV